MKLRMIAQNQYVLDTKLMRSNSVMSDRSWVARIIGLHPTFVFDREFVPRERQQSRPTNDGTQSFGPLVESEIYEYREIAEDGQSGYSYSRHGGLSGFFQIKNGEIEEIEKSFAILMLKKNSDGTTS